MLLPQKKHLPLTNKIALVTGASRGVGKGIALALGEAGATVYLTGRTLTAGDETVPLPGTLADTALEVTRLGGKGIPCVCDHRQDDQVKAVFKRIEQEQGQLDILVNNVWAGYESAHRRDGHPGPFWEQPIKQWDSMHNVGLRSHYVASTYAAPLMINRNGGLIVNISYYSATVEPSGVCYPVAKLAADKMAVEMARELQAYGVACVSLWPGYVRTEGNIDKGVCLTYTESPQFTGRAISALAADPDILKKTGQILVVAELAQEYSFDDVDGSRPQPVHQTEVGEYLDNERCEAVRKAMSI